MNSCYLSFKLVRLLSEHNAVLFVVISLKQHVRACIISAAISPIVLLCSLHYFRTKAGLFFVVFLLVFFTGFFLLITVKSLISILFAFLCYDHDSQSSPGASPQNSPRFSTHWPPANNKRTSPQVIAVIADLVQQPLVCALFTPRQPNDDDHVAFCYVSCFLFFSFSLTPMSLFSNSITVIGSHLVASYSLFLSPSPPPSLRLAPSRAPLSLGTTYSPYHPLCLPEASALSQQALDLTEKGIEIGRSQRHRLRSGHCSCRRHNSMDRRYGAARVANGSAAPILIG